MIRHLTNTEIDQAMAMYDAGLSIKDIATRLGVKQQTISDIVNPKKRCGKQWHNWFCSEWDKARYLVSGGKHGKAQAESYGTE